MRIYIAAPITCREEARMMAEWIEEELGIEVTSRWLRFEGNVDTYQIESPDEVWRIRAEEDIEDIMKADALIHFCPRTSAGAMTEFGFAIAAGKKVFSIGPFLNVFQHLEGVTWVKVEAESLWIVARNVVRGLFRQDTPPNASGAISHS